MNTDKNVSLHTFRIQFYAAWSRGVAGVGRRLVKEWERSWDDVEARKSAAKRFATERARVQRICDEMIEVTADAATLPMYDPQTQKLYLDKEVRERILGLKETPARVWFDSKRQFATHLRDGAAALLSERFADDELFDEDRERLIAYGYEQTSFTPAYFITSAGADVTAIRREVGSVEASDAADDETLGDAAVHATLHPGTTPELDDVIASHGADVGEAMPLVQTIGMLSLLDRFPPPPEHMRHTKERQFFKQNDVRAICTGFFQQRVGDFARDFDQLDRAGSITRSFADIGLARLPSPSTFLLPKRPGALLRELTEWVCADGNGLDLATRGQLIEQTVLLYANRGWINHAIDLVVSVAMQFDRHESTVWRLAFKIGQSISDRNERGRCFRLIVYRLLTQTNDVESSVNDAIRTLAWSGRYDYLVDLALECHRINQQAAAREVLKYVLPKIDDDELRTVRAIVPKDMAALASEYPERHIPIEWASMTRILVIEEYIDFRVLLKAVLERSYHEVLLSTSASTGIAQLSEQPDVIMVTDVMAGMTGIDFIAHIRDHAPALIPRIILFTTHPRITRAFEGCSIPAFQKPIDVMVLVKTLRDLPRRSTSLPNTAMFEEIQTFARKLSVTQDKTLSAKP